MDVFSNYRLLIVCNYETTISALMHFPILSKVTNRVGIKPTTSRLPDDCAFNLAIGSFVHVSFFLKHGVILSTKISIVPFSSQSPTLVMLISVMLINKKNV